MDSIWIKMIRGMMPPFVLNSLKHLFRKMGLYQPPVCQERDSAWYDQAFKETVVYSCPYTESPYYFLWCVVVDRILRKGTTSVLDIGCGPGQVARFLRDKGLKHYVGLDLSPVATKMAKGLCPEFDFITANAFDADVYATVKYDAVLSMEFLEHVIDEISVLERIPKGVRFIGTVPNFEYSAHVRHFSSCEEVAKRYGGLFESFSVDAFDAPFGSQRFFLIEGIKL